VDVEAEDTEDEEDLSEEMEASEADSTMVSEELVAEDSAAAGVLPSVEEPTENFKNFYCTKSFFYNILTLLEIMIKNPICT
jgi:hypothetical protein